MTNHIMETCHRFIKMQQEAQQSVKTNRAKGRKANRAQQTKSEDIVESAGNASALSSSDSSTLQNDSDFDWLADSGASSHMTPHRHWLHNYTPMRVPIKLADHSIIYSAGVGTVVFDPVVYGKESRSVEFTRVLHVPPLRNNLLSCLYLTRHKGIRLEVDQTTMHFRRDGQTLFTARVTSENSGILNGVTVPVIEHAGAASTLPFDINLWHRRLGHHSYADVQKMIKEGLVIGLNLDSKEQPDPICEPCLAGKMTASPFPTSSSQSTKPLELIHSDLHGPLPVATAEGYRYWITFIDDYSKLRAVMFLKRKSDAFEAFRTFKAYAENLLGCKIQALQDDKAGEYMSNAFIKFTNECGIARRHTTRNRPQQNGVAERANRTMADHVTAMMHEARMPASFWNHAVASYVFVWNRLPTAPLPKTTPYAEWYKRKPDVSNMRVWGCTAYVYIQRDKRKSLQSHMEKCIFVGYPVGYKGWQFYNPVTKKFIISERAVFDERNFPGLSTTGPMPHFSLMPKSDSDSTITSFVPELGGDDDLPPPTQIPAPAAPPAPPAPISEPSEPPTPPAPAFVDLPVQPPPMPAPAPDPLPPLPPPRRSGRTTKQPGEWWKVKTPQAPPEEDVEDIDYEEVQFAGSASTADPRNYKQAMKGDDAEKWQEAANAEYNTLLQNGTWELVELPPGAKAIGSGWVFRVKRNADGSIERYKARVVAKGYSQRPGIDFSEVFAPTFRPATLRLILALAALEDMELRSIDVSAAFTNGDLDEWLYMLQPEGFHQGGPNVVCRLRKSLYGLKQSARQWNIKLHAALTEMGFKRIESDNSVYIYSNGEVKIFVPIYIDDITLASKNTPAIDKAVKQLSQHFKCRDLGPTVYLLGVGVGRDRSKRLITLHQRQFILDMLERYQMSDCHSVLTPMAPGTALSKQMGPENTAEVDFMRNVPYLSAVGSLQYLATMTRPDIAYAVSYLARFNCNPGPKHWAAVKHLFRYLKGTLEYKLQYSGEFGSELFTTYTDAAHGDCIDSGRSTGGYVTMMAGGAIGWGSKLQSIVTLSTTEAEFVSAVEAGKEIAWMRNILGEFGYPVGQPSTLHIDNQSAISVSKNPEHHGRMKHLDLRYYWLRDAVNTKRIAPSYIPTAEQIADILTKPLPSPKVQFCRDSMGIRP
jgi:transposase InsO family protein